MTNSQTPSLFSFLGEAHSTRPPIEVKRSSKPIIDIYSDGATVGHNGKLGTVTKVGLGVWIPAHDIGHFQLADGISNNEGEFLALLNAMSLALQRGITCARFHCDSMIVIRRANAMKRPKGKFANARMDAFQNQVLALAAEFETVEFVWVPREENTKADELSKKAVSLYFSTFRR